MNYENIYRDSSPPAEMYRICAECDSCRLLRLIIDTGALNTDALPEFIALSDDEEILDVLPSKNLNRQRSVSPYHSESDHGPEKKRRKITRSPSLSPPHQNLNEDDDEVLFLEEKNPFNNEFSLDGSYYCEHCKISMNSKGTFLCHLSGKRHQKTLKAKNTAETVSKSITDCKVESRYPLPPRGVYRMKTKDMAIIQHIVERSLKAPIAALDKITEIQGLADTSYYCELCDSPCSDVTILPHLKGQRHQIQCVKFLKPEIYEAIRFRRKDEIEFKVHRVMKHLERRYGCGKLSVEKEFKGRRETNISQVGSASRTLSRRAFRSLQGSGGHGPDFQEFYSRTMVPDTSRSDFYCKLCDSHMNNLSMWEAHIRGKRHITNSKKPPGEAPSKTRSILVPGARAELMNKLDNIQQPVVGLDEMRETQNPDIAGNLYNCFMCGACVTSLDVVEHILSQKHRTKYLELIKHPDMEMLSHFNIQESRLYSLIEETCCKVEEERGRGYLEVHVVKSAVSKR